MKTSVQKRILFLMGAVLALAACGKEGRQSPPTAPAEKAAPASEAPRKSPEFLPESTAFSGLPEELAGLRIGIGGSCNLEGVGAGEAAQVSQAKKNEPLKLTGWAADQKSGSAPAIAVVELVQVTGPGRFYSVARRVRRPDVVKVLKNDAFASSGFRVISTVDTLPAGKYRVNVLQPAGGDLIRCSTSKKVEIH